jgi:hypothetical protein
MAWNPSDAQLAELERGWSVDGMSAGQLAAQFSQTRNVIMGIVHRRAWKKAGGDDSRRGSAKPAPAPRAPKPAPAPAKPSRMGVVVDDPAQHVAIDQLGPHHCRYPVGDAGKYCGQRPNETPYCDGHAKIVYQPHQPPRIKRPR